MQWKFYYRNVVKRYQVVVEGWPPSYPFKNLSDVSGSVVDLENLLRKWRHGAIHWRKLSSEEFATMDSERDAEIVNGNIPEPVPRRRRSDHGKKRSRNSDPSGSSKRRRSGSAITDTDDDIDAHASEHATISGSDLRMNESAPASTGVVEQVVGQVVAAEV
jgi:hypothetical protein